MRTPLVRPNYKPRNVEESVMHEKHTKVTQYLSPKLSFTSYYQRSHSRLQPQDKDDQ